ncbi:TIGR04282 family arsenosugar biosynthesis glycosyltransferase [Thauera sp.]|uniref:TIGR04282 family arsenosugar biosynthesis glycosyltransferase n=1 Tax=Thauera sp. TaxID=1905334 RepID=UPI002C378A5E|nr:TIGR04282 family arsenosugar biosynthesis glycosyltransferase [Thauera sp.]HRP22842.1 TIGR04282 family arsenosugar biosynthesis glycosyltransferase [Thauera sp.]
MSATRIVVFAKAPQPGRVKTRLIPALGAEGAASLAARMLIHALSEALLSGVAAVELCATPSPADAAWRGVELPDGLVLTAQGEGDLGARMARAAQRVIEAGEAVLLTGTDCPGLDAACLRRAANALCETDAVIGPTADGGYALLGLRRFDASLFEDIAWSTPAVARVTLARLDALGWSRTRLPLLHDIDEPADLVHLPAGW